jgi:hypothetical protein
MKREALAPGEASQEVENQEPAERLATWRFRCEINQDASKLGLALWK